MQKFRILFVCAEFFPYAKSGGLGDMTAGLASWLAGEQHDVMVALPGYGQQGFDEQEAPGTPIRETGFCEHRVRYGWRRADNPASGPAVYLLDCPAFFGSEQIYTGDEQEACRFAFLCQATLELCDDLAWVPDIVHCHDWHTAWTAPLVRLGRQHAGTLAHSRTLLTIHNIGYQGVFPARIGKAIAGNRLQALNDTDQLVSSEFNLLKTGIRYADRLTTVSPTHAQEIQTPEYGMGLDALLRSRSADLTGILNGVDYTLWQPETDGMIPYNYSVQSLPDKQCNRQSLASELGLALDDDAPLLGLVSRLAQQKGIDLLIDALPALLDKRAFACAFLGDGDPDYADALKALAARFPGRVAFVAGYDEALAHRIIAGSDLFVVPSRYEPCGLTQLYALRYGTVPVVRKTGGLADSVQHYDPATGTGTGCVFEHADVQGLSWGLETTMDWFMDHDTWTRLMTNGMQQDFSWQRQGPLYEELYRKLTTTQASQSA